jgi:hypothetical protein
VVQDTVEMLPGGKSKPLVKSSENTKGFLFADFLKRLKNAPPAPLEI